MSMDGNVSSPVPSENLTEQSKFEVNANLCTTSPHRLATRIATVSTVTPHSAKEETSASGLAMKRRKRRSPEEARTVSRVCQWTPTRTRKASQQSQLEEMSRQRPSPQPEESRDLRESATGVTSCNGEQIWGEQTSQFTKAHQRRFQQQSDELKPDLR